MNITLHMEYFWSQQEQEVIYAKVFIIHRYFHFLIRNINQEWIILSENIGLVDKDNFTLGAVWLS